MSFSNQGDARRQDGFGAGFLPRMTYLRRDKVLNEEQLKNLEKHKYSSCGNTVMDPYMQLFWNQVVKWMPLWLAPNLITLIGLAFNISGAILVVYYCPTATERAPEWVWAWNAFTLFLYQTLDAIDGKQARRTGSSSPLGELFDHGCDSISMFLVAVTSLCCIGAGNEPSWLVISNLICCTGFYNAHWATYISGKLEFGYIDVTEAQWSTISMYFLTFLFGQDLWELRVVNLPQFSFVVPLKIITFYLPLVLMFGNQVILQRAKVVGGGAGPNGSTIAGTSVLSPLSNLAAVLFIANMFIQSDSELIQDHPVLFSLVFGVAFAKISNSLIVAHMTKYEVNFIDPTIKYLGIFLYVNQYFGFVIPSWISLYMTLTYLSIDLAIYLTTVYVEIAERLEIKIFSIPMPKKQDPTAPVPSGSSNTSKPAEKSSSSKRIRTRSQTRGAH